MMSALQWVDDRKGGGFSRLPIIFVEGECCNRKTSGGSSLGSEHLKV